ncbi:hypothetical protein CVT24_005470 [Panaeolus cyanescens]|uniref:F-box domain-containing protein n=1 Tax=Panaeolus cyanescens TaxID=181874 RepID=A0A409YC23_9AGAR|nr:hypothetical protein CVT24_005470 [Panaeolus cyanescens]
MPHFTNGQTVTFHGTKTFVCLDIWLNIACYLEPEDLARLGKVSLNMRALRNHALLYRYSIAKLLRNFMPPRLYLPFREAQQRSRAVISGSAVLEYLAEADFGIPDLDIYVPQARSKMLLEFMTDNFEIVPTVPKRKVALFSPNNLVPPYIEAQNQSEFLIHNDSGYSDTSIAAVHNFHYKGRILQVISCLTSPMDTILRFHSTVVMNVVTATHAYCLYPRPTLTHMRGLINGDRTPENDLCLDKYKGRGYSFISSVPNSSLRSCALSPLSTKRRFVGDVHSFAIPLRRSETLPVKDTIMVNSWELWYKRYCWQAETSYSVFSAPRLSSPMVACNSKVFSAIRRAFTSHRNVVDDDFEEMDGVVTDVVKDKFPSSFAFIEEIDE